MGAAPRSRGATIPLPPAIRWVLPHYLESPLIKFAPKMVYLVGGYKLTQEQALGWCQTRDINPPYGAISLYVNRWLRQRGITQTRLLACVYDNEPIWLVVTNRAIKRDETPVKFMPFKESERTLRIKELLEVETEFITVANP